MLDIVGLKDVVCIKNEEAVVKIIALCFFDFFKQMVKCVTFAYMFFVESFVNDSSAVFCDFCSFVGAVIRHNVNIYQFCGVCLTSYAVDKMSDN